MRKKAFITGYYGFGNTGDEVILRCIVSQLSELRPGVAFTVASANPTATARDHGVEAIHFSNVFAMAEAVKSADLVILGGGGIFHDYWGFDPNAVLTSAHSGIAYYCTPAALAAVFQKPLMLYAVGVGPLFSEAARTFTLAAAEAAAAITVRDPASKEIFESLGVPAERVILTADPAYAFPVRVPAGLDLPGSPRIAVALRPWDVGVHPECWEREVAGGLDLFLENQPGNLLFIPFQIFEEMKEDDDDVAQRLMARLKHRDRAFLLDPATRPEDVLAACDLVVGMRLHSMILAAAANLPSVALTYDPKVTLAMERTGLTDFCLDIHTVKAAQLAAKMLEALTSGTRPNVDGMAQLARQNAQIANRLLDQADSQPIAPVTAYLLRLGLEAQFRQGRDRDVETHRLFHEVEYYKDQCVPLTEEISALKSKLGELASQAALAAQIPAMEISWQLARSGLMARIDELRSQNHKANEQLAARETAWASEKGSLIARIDGLSDRLAQATREVALAESVHARLTGDLAAREEHWKATERDFRSEMQQASLLVQGLEAELELSRAERQAEHDQHESRILSLETAAQREKESQVRLIERLREAESLLSRTRRAIDRFQLALSSSIETYKSQRAWVVMLAIRKAHDLATRHPVGVFLGWMARLAFSGLGPLDTYQLSFPNAWDYVPEDLHRTREESAQEPKFAPLTEALPHRLYDVVILPVFDYEFRFQRPQQVAAEFARRGHRVFWISPGRFLPPSSPDAYKAVALRENVWEIRLRGNAPQIYGGHLDAADASSFAAALSQVYVDFRLLESCVIVQFPFWRQIALALRQRFGARVAYDCMDDWRNWPVEPRISQFNLDEEAALCAECDVLTVSSRAFFDRERNAGFNPVLIRNGTDFDFFANPRPNDVLADMPQPIVGYYGAIAAWFDLELIAKLAEERPSYSLVLIGQPHEVDLSALQRFSNIHLLGEKNYRDLPLYLSHFDVCLIPFHLDELIKAVDPVKFYEYLSQGKPVVSTPLPELPSDGDLIRIGATHSDFIANVDRAVEDATAVDAPIRKARRLDFAKSNTWAARVRDFDQSISASYSLISILIVTFNCEEFIRPCLDSVLRNTSWPHYEVVVLDNGSSDGTKAAIEEYAARSPRIHVTFVEENLGFAKGNNLAATKAGGDYLVFLNPDTIVTPGWLGRLARHCERDPNVGAVAAVTNFSGNETKINFEYTSIFEMQRFAERIGAENRDRFIPIAVAALYCVLVPRRVWEKAGELDPSFEVGMFEDDDFSLRVIAAGFQVIAAEDCFIHHFGNGSFAKIPPAESLRIFEANRQRFEKKWGRPWQSHQLRPGVSAQGERRFTPADFLVGGEDANKGGPEPLVLRRLHPSVVTAGQRFNTQSDGSSALVVECANATPATSIVVGKTILATTYGNDSVLSALVPTELYARASRHSVHLLNDFGESNRIDLEVKSD